MSGLDKVCGVNLFNCPSFSHDEPQLLELSELCNADNLIIRFYLMLFNPLDTFFVRTIWAFANAR